MTSVLYFHGFASSAASAKITSLRPLLTPYGIELDTPDLNIPSFERLDFDAVVEHALARGKAAPPRAIVGSSVGSLVALAVARRGVAVPMVLIAPALGVARRWSERMPEGDPIVVFNFARGADVPIHRRFFEQMAVLDVDFDPPPSRVMAIMGMQDETVPYDVVAETWARWEASGGLVPGSSLVSIPEGNHSLVAYTDVIRDAIVGAVQ